MKINSTIPTSYKAGWPKNLDPALRSTCSKIMKFIIDVLSIIIFPIGLARLLFWAARHIALGYVIPGCLEINSTSAGSTLLKTYNGVRINLTSPDNAKLDGAFFPGTKHPKKAIIYAFGMAMQWETSDRMIKLLKPFGASILSLNPRGVGKSTGYRYEKGYALDIYTAYEYLIHEHHMDPEDIILIGFSMGGAYGTCGADLIQQKYPDKKISAINICSYADMQTEINAFINNLNTCFKRFGLCMVNLLGLNLKVKAAWDRLKGKKCIFYCASDSVIPLKMSLYEAVKQNPKSKTTAIKMYGELIPNFISHNRSFFPEEGAELFSQLLKMLHLNYENTDFQKIPTNKTNLKKILADQFNKIVRSSSYPPTLDSTHFDVQKIYPSPAA